MTCYTTVSFLRRTSIHGVYIKIKILLIIYVINTLLFMSSCLFSWIWTHKYLFLFKQLQYCHCTYRVSAQNREVSRLSVSWGGADVDNHGSFTIIFVSCKNTITDRRLKNHNGDICDVFVIICLLQNNDQAVVMTQNRFWEANEENSDDITGTNPASVCTEELL